FFPTRRSSDLCKEHGWSPARHEGRMAENNFAISPSCCYHCYEGMENWQLDSPGRCMTAILTCHRYEGANHRTMTRLRSFTMREVIWVGHPRFAMEGRAKAEELIVQWAKDWALAGVMSAGFTRSSASLGWIGKNGRPNCAKNLRIT